ncbi:hypothetical protein C0X52_22715 [Salmonella enterica]|nr:hypothetical protein [Salmonella enterica]EGW9977549.1 hypothetical protein [Salmonella enterica]
MHPQFLVWCLTFGAQFKNDGHYFCRAGGNRPDGLNEPVTCKGGCPYKCRHLPAILKLPT